MRLIFGALLVIALISSLQPPVQAQCTGPRLGYTLASGAPGIKLKLLGEFFTDGCHDLIINGQREPTLSAKNIRIIFKQGDHTEQLTAVDADKDYSFSVTVTIPANANPGEAFFFAEYPSGKTRPLAFTVIAKDKVAPKDSDIKPAR